MGFGIENLYLTVNLSALHREREQKLARKRAAKWEAMKLAVLRMELRVDCVR